MNKIDIIKILSPIVEYKKLNAPTPALLLALCFIESLSPEKHIDDYIKNNMPQTYAQLKKNDTLRQKQRAQLDCENLHPRWSQKCQSSLDLFYHHLRCVLVHDYKKIDDIKNGIFITNRPNKKQITSIIEQLKGYKGRDLKDFALIINSPAFINEFLNTL